MSESARGVSIVATVLLLAEVPPMAALRSAAVRLLGAGAGLGSRVGGYLRPDA